MSEELRKSLVIGGTRYALAVGQEGKGPPGEDTPGKAGVTYLDTAADPPVLYACTAAVRDGERIRCSWVRVGGAGEGSGQDVSLYIGPEEPVGENRPLYWLDTSADDAPVQPEEPDVPVEPEEPDPGKTLTGITVVYTGGDVAIGTAVSALTGITVTASYSDGTTEAVTGYILSGTVNEGSNTVTVTYQGKAATFSVTGVTQSGGEELPDVSAFTMHEPWLTDTYSVSGKDPNTSCGGASITAGKASENVPLTDYFTGDYNAIYAILFRPNADTEYHFPSKWQLKNIITQYGVPVFNSVANVSAPMTGGAYVDKNRLRWARLSRTDVLAALAGTEYTADDIRCIDQSFTNIGPEYYNVKVAWMRSEPTTEQQQALIAFFEKGGAL